MDSDARRPHPVVVCLVLLGYAVLIAVRMPQIVGHGRFWAEEGTIFFVNAWSQDSLRALLTPVGGYLNVVATAATLAARWGTALEWAPYVTMAVGGAFQLLPPLLLLLARDPWLADRRVRGTAVLLLLFVPAAEEVWLQTLHSQFELALYAALLLALSIPRKRLAAVSLLLLALAPLCGPLAIALLPLFALRAVLERSPGRALQAAALAAGSAVQLTLFFSFGSERSYGINPAVLLSLVTVKHLAVPFLGIKSAREIAAGLQEALAAGRVPWIAVLTPAILAASLLAAILRARAWTALWLLAGAATMAGAAYVGALDGAVALIDEFAGERYAFVPQSLLAVSFLALAARARGGLRLLSAGLCVWLLVVGQTQFRRPWPAAARGPVWREQVALWRRDPGYVLQIMPLGWTMRLDDAAGRNRTETGTEQSVVTE